VATKSKRPRRVAEVLQQEIATALNQTINDPRLRGLVITGVDLSPDLRNAKIFYVCRDQELLSEIKRALEKAKGFLRHTIATNTDLRHVPALHFVYDETPVRARNIDQLIKQKTVNDNAEDS